MSQQSYARRTLKNLNRRSLHKLPRRRSRAKKIVMFVGGALILALVAFIGWFIFAMQPVSNDTTPRRFTVAAGESTEAVAKNLEADGLIKNKWVFVTLAKLMNKHIQAGVHSLSPSLSAIETAFALEKSADTDDISITILAGNTLADLRAKFEKIGFSDAEITAAYNANYNSPLLADKPAGASLEGYIFPDTYTISSSDDLETLLEKAFDNLYDKMKSDGTLLKITQSGSTIYKTLTLASIVGKEVSNPTDEGLVAGVFKNRLAAGLVLGSDPTYQYAYKAGLCSENTPNGCDSSYNTRKYAGLPPGPIANMEYSAIKAVVSPTASNYYYFVAGDDGTTHYATTEDEHDANVKEYCTTLCR
jgi:UPF0755 protein